MNATVHSGARRAIAENRQKLTIRPLAFREACTLVDTLHRHHTRPAGHKFSLAVTTPDGQVVGAAIVGRPSARHLDDGWSLEVTRLVTDQTHNACSALLGAAWRAAKALGYRRLITYTQAAESGASLRGAGWHKIRDLPPRPGWNAPGRPRPDTGTGHTARILRQATAPSIPLDPTHCSVRLTASANSAGPCHGRNGA
jgi:hypothetical protein